MFVYFQELFDLSWSNKQTSKIDILLGKINYRKGEKIPIWVFLGVWGGGGGGATCNYIL